MKCLYSIMIAYFALALFPPVLNAGDTMRTKNEISHNLQVRLFPGEHRLVVKDTITIPVTTDRELHFLLHKGLGPKSTTPGVIIRKEPDDHDNTLFDSFKVMLPADLRTFTVEYQGSIYHVIEAFGQEQARGFSLTPGIISEDVVYLTGSSYWYPVFDSKLISFSLQAELPSPWNALSQGERTEHLINQDNTLAKWESPEPQDEIFLIASRFTEYIRHSGKVTAMAFLRTPDEELANKYLEATSRYIEMYSRLIGPYPYKKFALVENFWETGLGMPSFTLLGPRVIRLPFIINSSYPHEILHNWWGNSVFPDYNSGNWSEGLTAYLSDLLIREQQGSAADYRQTTLQKYADYVMSERDFPLTDFRSRHSSPSEAIGYGKSLMFFHMLRQQLGDKTFTAGLRDFFQNNKFGFASFSDIQKSFERVSGENLETEFNQWVRRKGAPKIELVSSKTEKEGDGFGLSLVLKQSQAEDTYLLQIPVAVTMEGEARAWQTVVKMDKKRIDLHFHLPYRPLRVDIDPEFDLFRRLDPGETPPAISQAFGAKKMMVILPSKADQTLLMVYRDFSLFLETFGPDEVEVLLDKEIKRLPSDRAITVLGWENLFLNEAISTLAGYDVKIGIQGLRIGKTDIPRENHSVVLTGRNPDNKEMAMLFIGTDPAEALPGLVRKLPHYHKYSYLAFEGDEPANIAKGRWPVLASPMTAFIPFDDGRMLKNEIATLAKREPLASLPQTFSGKRMSETVRYLTRTELEGRGLGTEGLEHAAQYIAERFREAGLQPAGDGKDSYFQTWEENMEGLGRTLKMKNVIGVIPGKKPEFAGQSFVIGAHYDHLGLGWPDVRDENKGTIHPGADDNASGVALMIELAVELRKNLHPDRTLVFVAFTGEEAGKLGSGYYAANQKQYPLEKCVGMLNLDTVGRLGKNKLLVLGAGSAREWVHIFRGASFVTGVELETVSSDLDSSDQISFQTAGVPAVQLFTGPHADYHRPTDTPEKIDAEGLEKVASVAKEVIEYLAGREEMLTVTMNKNQKPVSSSKKNERKVSLGTIPDFAYSGRGCRISGVLPETPAEVCGLKEGDVIVRINSEHVSNLKELSDILKSLNPGDRIKITFLRNNEEMTVETEVTEK